MCIGKVLSISIVGQITNASRKPRYLGVISNLAYPFVYIYSMAINDYFFRRISLLIISFFFTFIQSKEKQN